MLMEKHNNVSPPDKCRDRSLDANWMLVSWWFDDPEIAAFVTEAYGFPARHAAIIMNATVDATTTRVAASWGLPGMAKSSWSGSQVNEYENRNSKIHRYYWISGEIVMMGDFQRDYVMGIPTYVGSGVMNPPMLNSRLGLPVFPGGTDIYPDVKMTAAFQAFGDLQCEQPLQ